MKSPFLDSVSFKELAVALPNANDVPPLITGRFDAAVQLRRGIAPSVSVQK
jgi:hypothetical protein